MLTRLLTFFINVYSAGLVLYLLLRLIVGDAFWWLALMNTFAPYLFLPLIMALPLALMLRAGKTALITLTLTVIAVLWFIVPALTPKNPAATGGTTLRVVAFNILGKPVNNPRDLSPEMAWLLTTDADVIVLEEVVAQGIDPRLLPLRERYPYEAVVKGSLRIFSKYPYTETSVVVLEDNPGRLGLRVVFNIDGKPVTVYGVHLDVPQQNKSHLNAPRLSRFPFGFILHYDETRRNREIRRLLDILSDEPNPYIVAGDFNTSAYSTIYGEMSRVMVDSFAEAGQGFGHTWAVSRVLGAPSFIPPLIRIDYIWHSRDFHAIQDIVGPALNSDHFPVMATLELR